MSDKLTFLKSTVPYSELPENVLVEISALLGELSYPAETKIFDQGIQKLKGTLTITFSYFNIV